MLLPGHLLNCDRPRLASRQLRTRCALRFVIPVAFLFYGLCLAPSADAQHCGRVGTTTIWSETELSWERPSARIDDAAAGRLKGTTCEGPLCRSKTPQPFSANPGGVWLVIPLPWTSTSAAFAVCPDAFAGRLTPVDAEALPDPVSDRLFEPPRFV